MRALDRKLLRDLARLKGPLVTITLVVGCGVAVFVGMQATAASLERSCARYYERYRFADVFTRVKRAPRVLLDELRAIPGVADLEGRIVREVPLDLPELKEPAAARLVGLGEPFGRGLNALHLRAGRLPDPRHPEEVVAHEAFVDATGHGVGAELRAVVNGRREVLRVVGVALSPEYVYQLREGALAPDDRRFAVLWIGEEALEAAFDMGGAFDDLVVTLAPGASEAEVIARLDARLGPYGSLGAHGRDQQLSARLVADELRQLRMNARAVPPIFLAVAAFLLNVVLGRLVAAQREQIGALKALGYDDRAVGLHFLATALGLVAAGVALGLAGGALMMRGFTGLYARYFRFPAYVQTFEPGVVLSALAIVLVAALAGTLQAVRRVVRLEPVEAMRPAPPALYRRALVERLGLGRVLPVAGRMILRNLSRRPVRAALSTVAIGFAGAILIAGLFVIDSLEHLLARQYGEIERQDLTVTFFEPVSDPACRELAHLPGVARCEAVRAAPARLRHGHRSRLVAVTALEPGAELRRVVDVARGPVAVREGGLVLSRVLAERLAVARGDLVTVELLEGERRAARLPVARVIDDYVGANAYVHPRTLARISGESHAVSGALLAVDPPARDAVFAALERAPAVAGVTLREAARRGFEETSGWILRIFTLVLGAFASVIAVGVVYNGARVALAERAHELATLRVLGFRRAEISLILLGELAVQLVLGIPLGLLLGGELARLLAGFFATEAFRLPLVVAGSTYLLSAAVVAGAGLASALWVRRKLDHLDLVAVLKTKE